MQQLCPREADRDSTNAKETVRPESIKAGSKGRREISRQSLKNAQNRDCRLTFLRWFHEPCEIYMYM